MELRVDQSGKRARTRVDEGHARGSTPVDDEAELDVLSRLAERHAGCALVLYALEDVATRRDRAIVLGSTGADGQRDPSPAPPWLAATA